VGTGFPLDHDCFGLFQSEASIIGLIKSRIAIRRIAIVLYASLASARSLNFWILPVDVRGTSAKTTWRGHL